MALRRIFRNFTATANQANEFDVFLFLPYFKGLIGAICQLFPNKVIRLERDGRRLSVPINR